MAAALSLHHPRLQGSYDQLQVLQAGRKQLPLLSLAPANCMQHSISRRLSLIIAHCCKTNLSCPKPGMRRDWDQAGRFKAAHSCSVAACTVCAVKHHHNMQVNTSTPCLCGNTLHISMAAGSAKPCWSALPEGQCQCCMTIAHCETSHHASVNFALCFLRMLVTMQESEA